MEFKIFKLCFYIFLISLIVFFYTRNINFFGNNFYKNIKNINKPNNINVLVNKNNKLNKFYKPNDLVELNLKYSNRNKYLRKEAALQFELLSENARKIIVHYSSFYLSKLFLSTGII